MSDEEKLQIAQHFLLSSPPGQFQEVLAGWSKFIYLKFLLISPSDVKKLLPEGLLGDPLAAGIARAYHTKTNKVVTAPNGAKVKPITIFHQL